MKRPLSKLITAFSRLSLLKCDSKFKFGKSKNAQGVKESLLEIEFFTNSGEKVNCSLNSYLYTNTQEQYIDILYDPKNPKNVVYYMNNGK